MTIDRPDKPGAMTHAMPEEFCGRIARAGADPEVAVVLVTGVPGAFCTGIDLASRSHADRGRIEALRGAAADGLPEVGDHRRGRHGHRVRRSGRSAHRLDPGALPVELRPPRPGVRHRGGHLAAAPADRVLRLLDTGADLQAREALEPGFVAGVVEPEELPRAARELAAAITGSSAFALRRIERLVLEGTATGLREHLQATRAALEERFASEERAEGVAAFLERRKPRFTGR
ncbi:Enoyl-CoA hydratase/isomerase [Thermomonospora curvata DSM 43183]|uniref:Enoyl-CoA hydratase/isomerase n=1 Tax=Thermomonospora curvata (strain ATCC 19995 / DSM 43183 / JCM 3096 / KCTC 9072 / NBRC 15933 / NCIMB 10081 / Henssen B9) TaxID=471852 RepID=D1A5K5_THECD|nr:Enoyl-CoA hydratase/isomerase [Thermomonospora curvata DSM 43183]